MTADIDYDENSYKTVGEQELRRYNSIVEQHGDQLEEIIEALGPHPAPPWDPARDPVRLKIAPFEQVSLIGLVRSENKFVNKIVLALSAVCQEASQLTEEARTNLCPPLILYGTGVDEDAERTGEAQSSLSRILPLLHQVSCWVRRVQLVSLNILHQMAALYSTEKKSGVSIDVSEVHFQVVYEHLGSLLACIITLDEIVIANSILHQHWGAYRRLVRSAAATAADPRLALDRSQLQPLEKMLGDIEATVMQGNMFQSVVRQQYDREGWTVTRNGALREEMLNVIMGWCGQLDQSSGEGWWCDLQMQVVGVTALAVLHQVIFNSQDKKLAKLLINLFKKVPCVTLAGSTVWLGERYIPSVAPTLAPLFDRRTHEALLSHRTSHLAQKTQGLAKETQTVNLQVCGWAVNLDAAAKKQSNKMTNQDLSQRASLLLQGLILAHTVKYSIETVLNLHTALSRPMGRAAALSVCRLVESLKAIEETYRRHATLLARSLPHVMQYLTCQILTIVAGAKSRVSSTRLDGRRLDILMALTLVEQILSGSGTKERRLVTRIALSLANQARALREEDLSSLLVVVRRLELACEVEARVQEATCCSILYYHRVILPIYLTHYQQECEHPHCIHFMVDALQDCAILVEKCHHLDPPDLLLTQLKKEMCDNIKEYLLDKTCQAVETELRLSTHSHLQLDSRNPFTSTSTSNPTSNLAPLIHLHPITLLGNIISVKDYVEQYLERTFYALTVVAPHDWRTYEEMRNLATAKYGLFTVPSHLPSHTLDQGVDVLEIMRNIHLFVQQYMYNLNQQFFVEATSTSKHLNTVTITHIANSIRTHGSGIINTTVNFTYQFLRRKFHVFSQFLYDEHIKSRLLKDLQHWREVKLKEEHYPYERADKFNRGIRKLGLTPEGLTYLDKFRALITHIGNAMGYVRLVRSGGLHCSSNSARFLPTLQDAPNLAELCADDSVSPQTRQAALNLDAVVENLTRAFQHDTDYFKLLVDVFAPAMRDSKNAHLRNLYLIIPPLTLNHVENLLAAKDNMNKKNKTGAAFTDDGFAMGVAYLLKVLDQNAAFDSLHWWSGVRRRFIREREKVEQQRQNSGGGDDKLQQTLALTTSRLQQYQQEFELLYLSVSSAQVFFRGDWASSNSVTDSTDGQNSDTQSTHSASSGKDKPSEASAS
ncbi:hypothetical protein Pmani_031273 [Petrolisthes manimaculis]|uniref:WASH complex subunit 7 n=1 Tax=Petrolisthes manimaculis TaxID=1843537 RepID=A0AAE1TSN2_9EUCA|nr:hypothetical protein Pmani_031273 [Petrolisthes manimaculis]